MYRRYVGKRRPCYSLIEWIKSWDLSEHIASFFYNCSWYIHLKARAILFKYSGSFFHFLLFSVNITHTHTDLFIFALPTFPDECGIGAIVACVCSLWMAMYLYQTTLAWYIDVASFPSISSPCGRDRIVCGCDAHDAHILYNDDDDFYFFFLFDRERCARIYICVSNVNCDYLYASVWLLGQGGSSNARPIVVLLELWLFVVGLSAALLSWRDVVVDAWHLRPSQFYYFYFFLKLLLLFSFFILGGWMGQSTVHGKTQKKMF